MKAVSRKDKNSECMIHAQMCGFARLRLYAGGLMT
jgi:hypothetical protein